jgi:peptide/nickel transport system permease protein
MAVERAQASSIALPTQLSNDVHQSRKPQTYASIALQTLLHDKVTLVALGFILVLGLLVAFAGPLSAALVGVGPNDTNPDNSFAPPYIWPYLKWRLGIDPTSAAIELGKSGGITHWLGTDQLGRDQLTRLLYGGRVSLSIALIAAAIALLLGVAVGTVAGYFGGAVDDTVMWMINTIVSIPTIYLLIIVTALFKPNPVTLTLFLGFLGWFGTARFMRGNVFKVKALDYVLAARATGATSGRIMFQHVVPNSIPVIIIITALDVGALILTESALSFLGLGIQPPTATWGSMLNRASNFVFLRDPVTLELQALHLLIAPGLLITLTVLAFFLIGDGLRDALDPMLKNKGSVRSK